LPNLSARAGDFSAPRRAVAVSAGLANAAGQMLRGVTPRVYAGACLAAITVGIVANAVLFQHGHAPIAAPAVTAAPAPAPTEAHRDLAPTPAPTIAAAPPAQSAAPPVDASVADVRVMPPARPNDLSQDMPTGSVARAGDPIGDLLRAPPKDDKKLVMAAQTALVKLGYVLKADGEANAATSRAIADFERAHNLPQTGQVTPKIVKIIVAAANATGR